MRCLRKSSLGEEQGEGQARGGIRHWTAIEDQLKSAREILGKVRPGTILTAGGDCSCDVAVIDYLNALYPNLTVLWVDAHLDANTPESSPSASFHGMPVAMLTGGAPSQLSSLLTKPLKPSQVRYVSASVGDEGDWQWQKKNGLTWYRGDDPIVGPVHIHFDLDSLRPSDFGHVAYPEGELALVDAIALIRNAASAAEIVGLTITEFAPDTPEAVEHGSAIIRQLCEAALRQ